MRLGIIFLAMVGLSSCDRWTHVTANVEFIEVKNGTIYFEGERFTGSVITFGSNDKDTVGLYDVKDGKQLGSFQSWYANGAVNEIRFFQNNRRHGFHEKWYPNGKKAFEYHFDNGVYVDTLKEWYPNGQLYLLSHYKDGQPAGRQKAWRENGELYLNYDVVNGRKYGNAGIKHCKSLWSEVLDSL